MKGVSLATDTIVYIILAVLVLTVLLYFFTSTAAPAQTEFELRAKQRAACGQYIQLDAKCEEVPADQDLRKEFATVCGALNIVDCTQTSNPSISCIRRCCNFFCPTQA